MFRSTASTLRAAHLFDRAGFGGTLEEIAEVTVLGTDHGTATPIWLLGKNVKPGFHGTFPSLEDLDEGDLRMTTDFRCVYASLLEEWMGVAAAPILKGDFAPMDLFAPA